MPLFAALVQTAIANVYALYLAMQAAKSSLRLAVLMFVATAYVACVLAYSNFIGPLLLMLFSTEFGQLFGLLFPPISGSVLAGLVSLWGCMVAKSYYMKMVKVGLPS